jgi:hypothetical protein
LRNVLKSDAVQRVLAALIAAYMRLVFRLTRWTRMNEEPLSRRVQSGQPVITCFWHGRMLPMANFWHYKMPISLLGSPHRDGRLILRTVQHFGVRSIVGSSTRGGSKALREMVETIENGGAITLAPDGPRGPRMRASPGVIALAKLTGVPIIPATFSTSAGKVLASWDRFLLALPFGRGVLICGDPISVAPNADASALEAARQLLESRLNDITAEADRLCGRRPVEPAPLPTGAMPQLAETTP